MAWKGSKAQAAIGDAGRNLSESGRDEIRDANSGGFRPVEYHRGGKVRKTGMARLKKGERVIPRSNVKRVEKAMRQQKIRMKSSGR